MNRLEGEEAGGRYFSYHALPKFAPLRWPPPRRFRKVVRVAFARCVFRVQERAEARGGYGRLTNNPYVVSLDYAVTHRLHIRYGAAPPLQRAYLW